MNSPYLHERRRIMGSEKKAKYCQLIRESHSLEGAAEWLDVSIRTVQRERRRDEDFDHEVRLALQATPNPLRLMENAARTHWRAAAWLLERTRPEEYARKAANTARDYQVEAALGMVLEAALAATASEQRAALYQEVKQATQQAFQFCFPQLGPGGNLRKSKLPATPLADDESRASLGAALAASHARAQAAAERGEPMNEWILAPAWGEPLSPKTEEATASDTTRSDTTGDDTTPARATAFDAPFLRSPSLEPRSPAPQLSPKIAKATARDTTASEATDDSPLPIDFNLSFEDFAAAIATRDLQEQSLLWDQRLRQRTAAQQRHERRQERDAAIAR